MRFDEEKVEFLTGTVDTIESITNVPAKQPFEDRVLSFLDDLSRNLMSDAQAKMYSDVISFGFWIRKASIIGIKKRFSYKDNFILQGRGVAFHIAPSNVPVIYAYSLAVGLLTGNANIVRVSSHEHPQTSIITKSVNQALEANPSIRPYIAVVRYDKDKQINDYFSSISDTRLIWGGNKTIEEIRQSPLPARAIDVAFADRFSIAIIDSDFYMTTKDKTKVALDFYNDTYLYDQNACTSPNIVIWTGGMKEEAKVVFWKELHEIAKKKYTYQPIQGIDKLNSAYLTSVYQPGSQMYKQEDNLIVRVLISNITDNLMDIKEKGGFFFEYDCDEIMELRPLLNDKRCQTIGLLGELDHIIPLLNSGLKGVDRVVPIGRTMDFDLIWDGYDLTSILTRTIRI